MTAFASAEGAREGARWSWEMRGVNGKGLDLRLRLPEGTQGLEAALRERLSKALARGNVSLSLRLERPRDSNAPAISEAGLAAALAALAEIEARAAARGLALAPVSAAEVMAMRGVSESGGGAGDDGALAAVLLSGFDDLLAGFVKMRESEGAALARVLAGQLDEIARLIEEAEGAARARQPEIERALGRRSRGWPRSAQPSPSGLRRNWR